MVRITLTLLIHAFTNDVFSVLLYIIVEKGICRFHKRRKTDVSNHKKSQRYENVFATCSRPSVRTRVAFRSWQWSEKLVCQKKQQRKGEKIRNNLAGVAKQFYIARIGRSRPPVSSTSTFHEDDFRKARGLRRNRVVGFGETAWYPQPVSPFPIPSEIFYQTSLLPLFLPYPKHFFLILEIRHLNFT